MWAIWDKGEKYYRAPVRASAQPFPQILGFADVQHERIPVPTARGAADQETGVVEPQAREN